MTARSYPVLTCACRGRVTGRRTEAAADKAYDAPLRGHGTGGLLS